MNENTPSEIIAKFQAKYDWMKQRGYYVGEPIEPGIYRTLDGGWQCNYYDWCAIVIRPGETEPHEIHGTIGRRWYKEWGAFDISGKRGSLGHPTSDEEVYDGDGDPNDRISHFENGDIIWTAKTDETRIVNIKDRARWYEFRRNELLGLLLGVTRLELPEKYDNELRQTARKCQEDAFEIALVGEFQGGKSTTFNALCDGRDISPRGHGIKTSAAVVTAQNIAGDEAKDGLTEWAEVTFREAPSLVLGMSTLLRPILKGKLEEACAILAPNLSLELFNEQLDIDGNLPQFINLDNPSHRGFLQTIMNSLWDKWNGNKASLSDDELDELRIATLQLRFYGTAEHQTMTAKRVLGVSQFQNLIAFPKDWAIRWMTGADAAFKLEEVAFVFVHSVLLRIHSENLRRLGCRVTDCPGLFANAYDTKVAERTIANADAVWYLISGGKQIGMKDLEIVRKIADMGMIGKIEATCNLIGSHEEKMAEILPATKAALANVGHDVKVLPYNARLAFLAMQGSLLLDTVRKANFTAMDEANMRMDAKDKTGTAAPSAMWVKMVSRLGVTTELSDVEHIDVLDADAAALVRRESLLDVILSSLETEIIPKKARSILVDRGSARAAKALVAYEGDLKATENAAKAKEAEWEAKVKEARAQLEDFITRAEEIVSKSSIVRDRERVSGWLARSFVSQVLGNQCIDIISNHVCEEMDKIKKNFYLSKKRLLNDLRNLVMPRIQDDLVNSMRRCAATWKPKVKEQSEGVKMLLGYVDDVCSDIHDLWEDRDMDKQPLIAGIAPPSIDDVMVEDIGDGLLEDLLKTTSMEEILQGCRFGFWECLFSPFTLLWDGIQAIIDFFRSDEEKRKRQAKEIDKCKARIQPAVDSAVNGHDCRGKLEQPISKQMSGILKGIEANLKNQLDGLKADFERERVAKPQSMFDKSAEERQRIAEANEAIRTGTIEPLRKRIEAFAQTVKKELVE